MTATNRGSVRQPYDHYATPGWLTRSVLPILEDRLKKSGAWPNVRVLEPACGPQQAIANVIKQDWPQAKVDLSDIIEPWQADFTTLTPMPCYDVIITNPPFYLAQEFCDQAMKWRKSTDSLVVMLLRINFLASLKRAKWVRAHTPTVAISPRRPSFIESANAKTKTDSTEYGWFIWPSFDPMLIILETEDKPVRTTAQRVAVL